MAKDIAQRELDQGGFKISNLGTPTAPDDATKTDNVTVPRPSSGSGVAGSSLLAAPIDHVHPAGDGGGAAPVFLRIADPTTQSVDTLGAGDDVLYSDVVEFDLFAGPKVAVSVSAEMMLGPGSERGELFIRLDGDPADAAAGTLIASLITRDPTFTRKDSVGEPFIKPSGRHRITIVGSKKFLVREKEVIFTNFPE